MLRGANARSRTSPSPAYSTKNPMAVEVTAARPWNDSNKNLVGDVARALTRYDARVLVPRGTPLAGVAHAEEIYPGGGGAYAPSRLANARVFARLLGGPRADVWHFYFGPNP